VRTTVFLFICICVAVALVAACGQKGPLPVTITKLAFGTNAKAEPSVNSFEVDKVIYVVANVENAVSKHHLDFRVTVENNVENKALGDPIMNKGVDFSGNDPLFLNFMIAFPGQYKVEAVLTDPDGKQIDSKSGSITVTGEAAPPAEEHDMDRDDKDNDRDRDKDRGKDREHERERGRDRDRDKDRDKDHK
jgi:putative lipoprotein